MKLGYVLGLKTIYQAKPCFQNACLTVKSSALTKPLQSKRCMSATVIIGWG